MEPSASSAATPSSDEPEMINIQIFVPEIQVRVGTNSFDSKRLNHPIQKCLPVSLDDFVWDVKRKLLATLPQVKIRINHFLRNRNLCSLISFWQWIVLRFCCLIIFICFLEIEDNSYAVSGMLTGRKAKRGKAEEKRKRANEKRKQRPLRRPRALFFLFILIGRVGPRAMPCQNVDGYPKIRQEQHK